MSQLRQLLNNLTHRQKLTILAAVLISGLAIAAIVNRGGGDYRVLYSRLSAEDASAVAQKLKEAKIDFRIGDDGGSVLVPAASLAASRLALATAGLPKSGRVGFELFDKTNLTATDFAEHVNYARALEGELERSIQLIEEIERARVHITFPKESVFIESRQPAKASVVVGTKPGTALSQANVNAITHLVASAVQGLSPETVAVVDFHGQLLGRPRRSPGLEDLGPTDAFQEYRVGIEREMQLKLTQALEPVLGTGKFKAGVSVDCDFSTKEESEEALDPTKTVVVSEQKSEESSGSSQPSGVPGTASTLPRPTARPASSPGGVSRKTLNSTYQTTRSLKSVKTPRGQIKRVTVAIVVDHDVQWKGEEKLRQMTLVPPPKEKLDIIAEIATNILGLQESRGDQITVESLPFDSTLSLLRQPAPDVRTQPGDVGADSLKTLWNGGKPTSTTIMQGAALIVMFIVTLVGLLYWRKKDKKRSGGVSKANANLPPASEEWGAQAQLEPGIQRHLHGPSGLALPPAQRTESIREDVRKDPRTAAAAVRRMLAPAE